MSKDQLQALVWRMEDGAPFDPSDPRSKDQAAPAKPSAEEKDVIRRYVLAELARRPQK
jgi:hypothetical protein